jgi:hypothetical protein
MSKLGNKESECEDSISFNLKKKRFAIADGASSSMFSDVWASCLTSNVIDLETDLFTNASDLFHILLPIAREEWYSRVEWNNLKWFQTNKSFQGSYSTLLYLEIKRIEERYLYRALCVGDSCMFVLGPGGTFYSFPYKKASQFNNSPKLIWTGRKTQTNNLDKLLPDFVTTGGYITEKNEIILATDALSKWLIETHNFSILRDLVVNDSGMRDYLSNEIDAKRMRNDDISLIYLSFT